MNFIPTKIKTVFDKGIETEDGAQQEVDVIICATGFDGSVCPAGEMIEPHCS